MLRGSASCRRCSCGRAEGDVAAAGICPRRLWLGGGDRAAEGARGNPAGRSAARRAGGRLRSLRCIALGRSAVPASEPSPGSRTVQGSGGNQVRRRALLSARLLQDDRWVTPTCHSSTSETRCSRFDPDGSGRPATWDNFGIWDNRIDEPILLPPSIKYGKPIPKVSLANVGCASQIGKRKENEDRFGFAQLTDEVLYFAVYDGHGGPAAADFCHTHMEKCILYVQMIQ
ncbi:Protein phosphatase 1K, mitochondrial, partial [Eschrichtius robustus]|nr:Protein phosphatase 1K, mitochondrial [Eschrichtius robustus]